MIKLSLEFLRKKNIGALDENEFLRSNAWFNDIIGTYRIIRFDCLGFKDI